MRALTVIAVLVVAALAAGLPAKAQDDAPATEFDQQASGGREVTVASVTLPVAGFVAIHDATLLEGNVLGSVVGVSPFLDAGEHADVRVRLTRALEGDNETLIAMPHQDTNGNRIYDFVWSEGALDGPFKGGPNAIPESFFEENAPALAGQGLGDISAVPATVNVTASLRASAQNSSGQSVLVDFVDLSAPGYVAIHDATLVQNPGENGLNGNNVLSSVVGVSDLLSAGTHRDVRVALGNNCTGCKTDGNLTGTLIPMAHIESGGNESRYDFVASGGTVDVPFTGATGTPTGAVIAVIDVTYSGVATQSFPAQATGGNIVLFPEVFVPEGGYAAVHDERLLSGEVLASVVGVSEFLAPGLHRNVSVTLDFNGGDGLNRSQTVVGMLHRETNNNTSYDFVSSQGAQDGPYTGGPSSLSEEQLPAALQGQGLGGVNAVPAAVNLSAAVRLAPYQDSTGDQVRVEWADFSESGFVALHDETLLADPNANVLSSVVGVSAALEGLERNLTITLGGSNCAGCVKGALNVSQTLIAMPHHDSDGDGAYGFITSQGAKDGPFVTGEAASNTVNALDLNIVVAQGRVIVPTSNGTTDTEGGNATGDGNGTADGSAGNGTTGDGNASGTPPATSTPPATTPPATTPADTPEENQGDDDRDVPGFGLVALVIAIGAAVLLLRRR